MPWKIIPKREIAKLKVASPTIHLAARPLLAIGTRKKLYLSSWLILIKAPSMRCAAAAILVVSLAFASQASAVLRPLFPAKTAPPFAGEAIVIGNGSIAHPAKQVPATVAR
ncbi:MAG: hypothetical protein DMF01_08965 [Verrucomicrobia bacterium]|nr:MAG: hypothetical protein DMF01_08965 [Verrucomicrobiota bacterium]